MKKVLYLMRHGQTLFNELKLIQGACDSPLTKLGIEQAQTAKKYFEKNNIKFDKLYSSTQERACDTLEITTNRTDYIRLKGIKEWNFGKYEASPEYLNPPHKNGAISYEDYFVDYGGESVSQVGERMKETLTNIMNGDVQNVLAVSHGGAMWAFFLSLNLDSPLKGKISNCCIFEYEFEDNKFNLIKVIDPVNNLIYNQG